MVRVRFAPSPTGYLHLGNTRVALLNWLFARHTGGAFLLRIDDTDTKRSEEKYIHALKADLSWLGLEWDETFAQSSRYERYAQIIETLKKEGRIYPCYESAQELADKRAAQLRQGTPPIYDRASLGSCTRHGDPHWRFFLEQENIFWKDHVQGAVSYHTKHLSDPIVIRQDGSISYLFSSVIDDIDTQITHILRGADHITNTAVQIQMMKTLGHSCPQWAHFPLMVNAQKSKLSKRSGALTIQELRDQGVFPLAICQTLANVGSAVKYEGSVRIMAESFDLDQYSNSCAQLDLAMIDQSQRSILHTLSCEEVSALTQKKYDPAFWSVICSTIDKVSDIEFWDRVVYDPHWIPERDISQEFCAQALGCLPPAPWHKESWKQWIEAILELDASYTKKEIAMSLRAILTEKNKGPQMNELLALIPPTCVYARLSKSSQAAQALE
jgi:glutamyl-tRNA synthetase